MMFNSIFIYIDFIMALKGKTSLNFYVLNNIGNSMTCKLLDIQGKL